MVFVLLCHLAALGVCADSESSTESSKVVMSEVPEGAIVLFGEDGKTDRFFSPSGETPNWKVEQGELISTRGGIRSNHISSKLHFRDAEIHVEFCDSDIHGGNSGIYLHGLYELQIYNSHGKETPTMQDCGAIYGISVPKVNAALPPGEWQTYDILFIAPRRDTDGKITTPGRITAWLNGKLVQDKVEIRESVSQYHPYRWCTTHFLGRVKASLDHSDAGPVFLQDHDSPVRFRNVWVKPLDDKSHWYEDKKED